MSENNQNNNNNQIVNQEINIGEAVVLIAIKDIDTTDRLREPDSDYVDAIAASIAKEGLLQPIDICKLPNQASKLPYRLVAGGHRIEAYKKLNFAHIPSFIRSHEADARRAREIAENVFKTDLKPLERAKFVAELIEIEKRRGGLDDGANIKQLAASSRWNREGKRAAGDASATIAQAFGFNERVAEKLGVARRTVYNDLELLRIPPSVVELLKGHEILENATALKRLSKQPQSVAIEFANLLKSGIKIKDAFDTIEDKKPAITDTQKNQKAFIDTWQKMTPSERVAALKFVTKEFGLPKGVTIDFGDVK